MLIQAVNFSGYLLIMRTLQIARTLNLGIQGAQDMISMQELRFPSKTRKHFGRLPGSFRPC